MNDEMFDREFPALAEFGRRLEVTAGAGARSGLVRRPSLRWATAAVAAMVFVVGMAMASLAGDDAQIRPVDQAPIDTDGFKGRLGGPPQSLDRAQDVPDEVAYVLGRGNLPDGVSYSLVATSRSSEGDGPRTVCFQLLLGDRSDEGLLGQGPVGPGRPPANCVDPPLAVKALQADGIDPAGSVGVSEDNLIFSGLVTSDAGVMDAMAIQAGSETIVPATLIPFDDEVVAWMGTDLGAKAYLVVLSKDAVPDGQDVSLIAQNDGSKVVAQTTIRLQRHVGMSSPTVVQVR